MRHLLATGMLCAALAIGVLAGCGEAPSANDSMSEAAASASTQVSTEESSSATADSSSTSANDAAATESSSTASVTASTSASITAVSAVEGGLVNATELFTERDLTQGADLSSATALTLENGKDIEITQEGVYVVSGSAENATIMVNAPDTDKVQIVLDNASITNETAPAINVVSADKVFVTLAEGSTNTLEVTGAFASTEEDNIDGVVFSKDDIIFNGAGTLVVNSSDNGLVGKDDVKITGGTYQITATGHAIEGKDSVAIADGSFTLDAGTDAIHSDNADDDTKGYVYIGGGTFNLVAGSDGIEGDAFVQIDAGSMSIQAAEGIEGTTVQINGGEIGIGSGDDAINATSKSSSYPVKLEINGGTIAIAMAEGDTDALDSNGDLIINGGTVDITAQFAFDFDGAGELNGGTVIVNGEEVTELANAMMGGGMGGMGGGRMGGGQMGGAMGGQQ